MSKQHSLTVFSFLIDCQNPLEMYELQCFTLISTDICCLCAEQQIGYFSEQDRKYLL